MMAGIKLYKLMASASIRSFMQYKFSFIINFFLYALIIIGDVIPVMVILYHFKSIGGWEIYQIAALWGAVSAATAVIRAFCAEIHNFEEYIIRGEFDGLLLRPWPTLLILMGRKIELFRLSVFLQGLIVLVVALLKMHAEWWVFLYVPVLISTGVLVFFGLEIIIASAAFWLGRTGDLLVFLFYGPSNAALYPLSIFPRALRAFLTIWPVAFVGFQQFEFLLGYGGSSTILWLAPVVGLATVVLALGMWRAGERVYYSTGS